MRDVVYNAQSEQLKEVEEMKKALSFLAGLFAGALVGGVAAILLAPYSGHELQDRTRARIRQLIEEGKRSAAVRRAELEAQLNGFKRGASITIDVSSNQPET